MLNDLRYASRLLARAPGFTLVAVLSMALGIGGTSAVFSLFYTVFLAPLPFPDADRLVAIAERRNNSRTANLPVSGHEYRAWKEQTSAFEDLTLFRGERQNLTGIGEPASIAVLRVASNYFHVLQLNPHLGRTFTPDEDRDGADVVVLSDALWRRRFGGDSSIVGRTMMLDDRPATIVGVLWPLPPSLSADVWMPLDVPGHVRAVGRHNLGVVGRLKPDVTLAEAHSQLTLVSERLAREVPDQNADHHAHVAPLRDELVGQFRRASLVLFAAVGFVLLIACANLANLLLSRGAGRQREMAVRAALGAGEARLLRQLLVESVLLTTLGGAVGLILAAWMVDLAPALTVVEIPLIEVARLDTRTLAVTAMISLGAGILSGLAPALRYVRATRSRTALVEGNRMSDTRERRRLRIVLVAAEVAWTLMLLVGAGLMLNSFIRLVAVNPGFSTERVLVVPVDLPGTRYPQAEQRRQFHNALLDRLSAVEGVASVAATSHLPLGGTDNWMMFTIDGRPAAAPGQVPTAAFRVVTADYFRTMEIPLRRGRWFNEADARLSVPFIRWFPQQPLPPGYDRPQPSPVAVISEAAARQFWPDEDPIGGRIRVLFAPPVEIVGIVGDIRHNALNLPAYPHIYLAANQEPWSSLSFVIRTSVPPTRVAPAVLGQVKSLDPNLPLTVRLLDDVRSGSVNRERFYVFLIALFGIVALALAVIGIVGVVGYSARQRTMEIGVRLALGAAPREIVALIVRQGMLPIGVGIAAGTLGALGLTGFMRRLLYDVDPTDPLTFAVVIALLTIIALVACWVPAARAARLDPVAALRSE